MKDKIIIISLLLVLFILGYKGCQYYKEKENLLNQVSNYKNGEKEFKTKLQKDSSTIAEQKQTILSQDEAIKLGILKLEGDIKKVQSQVRQSQTINIDDIAVPFVPDNFADTTGWMKRIASGDSSRAVLDSLLANTIIVPKKFFTEKKWYTISGVVKKDEVLFDSIKVNNESSVTIGWKKTGFLGFKNEAVVEVKNTNPYLQVTKLDNVVIKKKKGVFESKLFWGGLGILGGLILSR
jgi:hypothetical protein